MALDAGGMLCGVMKPPGAYKLASRARGVGAQVLGPAGIDALPLSLARSDQRVQRILESLRSEIVDEGAGLRIRQVFETPREIFRLELELPELGYQRTILLDREALEELLEADGVRAVVASAGLAP